MKIVADENIPLLQEIFGHLGEVVRKPGRNLCAADVEDADALIVRSVTPVNQALLEHSKVRFVGTCTIGTDHLDTQWLNSKNISWSSAPGCNANSVVEYVFSALSALNVDWQSLSFGIVGCGNVGGALYRRLKALGVPCKVYDPLLDQGVNVDLGDLDEALGSDIVCLHAPLTKTGAYPSQHLLNATNLPRLKPGAVLLNAGRGAVIDNRALLELLQERDDLRVVLDVWEHEPNVLTELLEKVDLASPHIAGYSYDGKVNGSTMIYRALCLAFGLTEAGIEAGINYREILSSDSISNTVLSAYDVRDDDKRMRVALRGLAGTEQAMAFDQLRKEYPRRHEFSHYFLSEMSAEQKQIVHKSAGQKKGALSAPELEILRLLGFR